ncbi:autotransporter domain-containing protein [Microbulbifer sp. THAF38]|uniref:autotransporter domain-containing protein n=1 Tax=Microbulbifer sp. THAF38 TaxID=2587856 RepID=UPI0012689E3F|nr:autotransporter domain-containing protein [Microbulbifer sp. THAF38]QFT56138.1 Esterase EstP precursor [Microbulbifer sp. THAF38]
MPNAKRSLAAAIALASLTSVSAIAEESAFSQVIAFGDSLTDVGNYDVFTNGGDANDIAINILSQNLGLSSLAASCAGMQSSLCLPSIDPALMTDPAELEADVSLQVLSGTSNAGSVWAVGGHKAADVLMNIIGTESYMTYLQANGLDADVNRHNLLSAFMPKAGTDGSPIYPDQQLAGLLKQKLTEAGTYAAMAKAAFAQGDLAAAAGYQQQAEDAKVEADQALQELGTFGNPHPLGKGYLETRISADTNALYWVNGGGNDLLTGFKKVSSGDMTMEEATAEIGVASAMMATAASALSGAGANYILVSNVPDISKTPAIYAGVYEKVNAELTQAVAAGQMTQEQADAALPAAIDEVLIEASKASEAFNASLLAQAKDIDGVLMVDQAGLLKVALNNAGQLGLSAEFDQSQFCYDGSGGECIEHPVYGISQDTADASKLIFNDTVHPTQVGQQVLADYYTAIVNAAQVAGQLPDIGAQAARTHINTLDENLVGVRYSQAQTAVFAGSVFGDIDYDNSFAADMSGDSNANLIGMTYALRNNLELGFAVSRSDIDVDNARSDIESTSTNYSLFGRFHHDVFFVEGSMTLTDVDFDQANRALTLGNSFASELEGDTTGENTTLSLTVGANLFSESSYQLGPFIGVTRATMEVDGYTEKAIEGFTYTDTQSNEYDPLGMNYGDQERDYNTLRFGAFANKSWNTVNAYAQIWYEDTNGTDEDTLEVGVKSMAGNMNAMPSYSSVDQGLFDDGMGLIAGIRWQAADSLALSANVTSRPAAEQASVNVTYRF